MAHVEKKRPSGSNPVSLSAPPLCFVCLLSLGFLFGMGGSCVHEGEKSSQVTCPGGKAMCHKAEKLSVQGSVPAAGLWLGGSPARRSPVNKSKQAAM